MFPRLCDVFRQKPLFYLTISTKHNNSYILHFSYFRVHLYNVFISKLLTPSDNITKTF